MNKIIYLVIFLPFFNSCSVKRKSIEANDLIGVWSGILFQTESAYDSIIVQPATAPNEAIFFKDSIQKIIPLTQEKGRLFGRDTTGLRFDALLTNNSNGLEGIITNDLWVQNLGFKRLNNQWHSKIIKPEIIDTDYKVYLEFFKDSLGVLNAKIQSNKENRKLHFTIEEVHLQGDTINFKITSDRFSIAAKYRPEKNTILLNYGNGDGKKEIELKKLTIAEEEGYHPRKPNEKYKYHIPKHEDDFIKTASLEEVGIDPSMVRFIDSINNGEYDHIHSIIITKNHKLVFEEYFHGTNREQLHDIRSAFKSFASLLLGKAMMNNKNLKITDPILKYYPEYKIEDVEKKKITVYNVLTMSTGIELENEDEMQWNNTDWVGYKLKLPMKYPPGEQFEYSSGGANLLSGVIQESMNQYLPQFLYEELLLPMNIEHFQMRTSPLGRGYMAGDFYLRPIDFTKFGILVLNKGKWDNKQLIDEQWITESTTPKIKCSWPKNADYGYLWRILNRKVGDRNLKTIEAWGNGGQFLIIIPEIDMTITFTGGNYNLFPEMEDKPFKILTEYILPSIKTIKN